MTSTTGTDGHPEAAEISALSEGILPPERSSILQSHLSGCDVCADVRRSLDEIRTLLGTLPSPGRMPADIADRIDAALAAEGWGGPSAEHEHESTADVDASLRHPTPACTQCRLPEDAGVSRETPAAARRPPGRGAVPSGPDRHRTRRRWTRALMAVCAAAVLAGGAVVVRSLTVTGNPPPTAASRTEDFSGVALPERVHQLLASASPKAGAQAAPGNPMHLDMATVPVCVLQGTGRSGQPLASSRGRYAGRDAYLILLPHPSDQTQVDAYVVDASCDAMASPSPGHPLVQVTYRRG